MRRVPYALTRLVLLAGLISAPAPAAELKDLYFGEALYYAHQGYWFEALERLDSELKQLDDVDEPELDSLFHHVDAAEFSLGDFELRYRMHHRAGRAINAVLESAVDDSIRNDAAYRLARIHFQKGQVTDAARALARIEGKVPASIRDEIEFLRGNIHLADGRPQDAIDILESLRNSDSFGAFAAYNLGIAYLQAGDRQAALAQLDAAGQLASDDPADLAIRDKSNLVLGTILLEDDDFAGAIAPLNRVRLNGPFSNQALLSLGWANLSADDVERAVVPWNLLAERDVTDRAVQEAMLTLPYAYGRLDLHGRAATHYGRALDSFSAEIDRLNISIESIRDGKFLAALKREEIRKDKDWVIRLRSLPDSPETFYLMELLASHDFQTGLDNYLDLADLRRRLQTWGSGFDSFDEMVTLRHDHYEPLLPEIDAEFRDLDSRMRLRIEQHRLLVQRRDHMLTTPRPEFLATRAEQAMLRQIERLEEQLDGDVTPQGGARERLQRLRGILSWRLETEYYDRLAAFDRNLRGLDQEMAVLREQYDAYVRARQAATHSFVGYEEPIRGLRSKVRVAIDEVERLMDRQGRALEIMAVDELVARRTWLDDHGNRARFALADSLDRATQAQARAGME